MKTIIIILSTLFNISVYSQAPAYAPKSFAGRYVKWASTQNYFPTEPVFLNDISAFWDEPFYLNVYVHQNLIDDLRLLDITEVINQWNGNSNFARMSYAGVVSGNVTGSYSSEINPIFRDDFDVIYPSGTDNSDRQLAVTRHWGFYVDPDDCSNTAWGKGPVLIGGYIAINPDVDFHAGYVPQTGYYSFQSTAMHEFGHLLGLNHISNPLALMYRSLERSKPKNIHFDDRNAINRLYGYDGLNNTQLTDPLYNSIQCSDFDFDIKGLLGIREDGTYSDIVDYDNNPVPDPCNNCISDPGELGVDCGGTCPDDCKTKQTGNTISKFYIEDNAVVLDFTVVQDRINIGSFLQNTIIDILDGDTKYMRAGNHIEIGSGFNIEIGAKFEAEIGESENFGVCDFFYPNVFTPNCDGINDYLSFYVSGADRYDVYVMNYDHTPIYENYHAIYTNQVLAWNFLDVNQGHELNSPDFYYLIRFRDANTGIWYGDPSKSNAKPEDWHLGSIASVYDPCPLEPYGQYLKSALSSPYLRQGEFEEIKIFPNPSTGFLNIESKENIFSIEIFSFLGTVIYKDDSLNVKSTKLDLRGYPNGMYFIRINNQFKPFTLTN